MHISQAIILGLVLGSSMIIFGGCSPWREKAKTVETREEEGGKKPLSFPFIGDDIKTASAATIANLQPLYRVGYVLLGVGVLVGLLRGLALGAGIAGGGIMGVAVAVLFSEYPRAVLVLPVLGTLFLIAWGIIWFKRLWGSYRAMKVVVPTVDELDTGPKSAGRRVKEAIAKTGFGDVVRRGIKFIKNSFKELFEDDPGAP